MCTAQRFGQLLVKLCHTAKVPETPQAHATGSLRPYVAFPLFLLRCSPSVADVSARLRVFGGGQREGTR